jgi:Reverse transcriptase (RNA-dependent DNA polymerase)
VLCDTSFRIILLLIQKLKLPAWSIDVETAFLNGDLNEEIYMRIPEGFEGEGKGNSILKLNKSIYGLVQAARQWHNKFEEIIVKQGFKGNNVEPCVFHKQEGTEFCVLCIYVDDGIITGSERMMIQAIEGLNQVFKVKVDKLIQDFLGCKIGSDGHVFSLKQTRIIKKLEKESEIKGDWNTPSAPGLFVVRPKGDDMLIGEGRQKWFRSMIGTLLYLVKLSRPDIANAVRELSKVMDNAVPAHEKELKRLLSYVVKTQDKQLNINSNSSEDWEIEAYSNSDFAGDKDNRKSITGFVIFLCGFPISWKSKAQPCVTLSSTEAEYVSLNETVRELKFIVQLLALIGIPVKKPTTVHVDNVGCIFLAKNKTSGERTKHIDMKYHFIREQVENGLVEIKFVRSEDNVADIFTKNLGGEKFNFHSQKLFNGLI